MTLISSYADLIVVLRARRLELGMSLADLDARAGFQDGWSGKLEAWAVDRNGRRKPNTKPCGWPNLPNWMGALGLVFDVVEDENAKLVVKHDDLPDRKRLILEPHLEKLERRKWAKWAAKYAAKAGSTGGKVAAKRLGKSGRRKRAKRAAKARWARRGEAEAAGLRLAA